MTAKRNCNMPRITHLRHLKGIAMTVFLFLSPLLLPKGIPFINTGVLGEAYAQNGFNKFYTVKVGKPPSSASFADIKSSLLADSGVSVSGLYHPDFFSNGSNEGGPYLMRLDKNGAVKFAKYYQSPGFATQWGGFATHFPMPDGGFMLGGPFINNSSGGSNPPHSVFTLRIDKLGAIKYFKYTSSPGTMFWRNAIMTRDSNVVTTSEYYSKIDINTGSDISIFSIDASGKQKWGKIFRGPKGAPTAALDQAYEYAYDLDTVQDGGVIVAGSVQVYHPEMFSPPGTDYINKPALYYYPDALVAKIDVSGNLLWSKVFHARASVPPYNDISFSEIISTSDGGFLATGGYGEYPVGPKGPMLAKLDKDGNLLWIKVYREPSQYAFSQLGAKNTQELTDGYLFNLTGPGKIVFPGDTQSTAKYTDIVIKTDFTGKVVWAKENNLKKVFSIVKGNYAATSTNALLYAEILFKTKPVRIVQSYTGYDKWGITDPPPPFLGPPLTQRDSSGIKLNTTEIGLSVYCTARDSLKKWLTGYESCLVDPVIDTFSVDINKIQLTNDVLVPNGTLSTSALTYNALDMPVQRILSSRDTIFCDGTKTYALNFTTSSVCSGIPVAIADNSFGYYHYHWNFGDNTSGNNTYDIPNPQHIYQNAGTYTVTLTAYNKDSTVTNSYSNIVNIIPSKFITVSNNVSICSGDSVSLSVSGAASYYHNLWQPALALSDSTIINPKAAPTSSVTYTIIGWSVDNSCTDTGRVKVNVSPIPTVSISGNNSICLGGSTILSASGSENIFLWNTGATTASISVHPKQDSVYSVSTGNGACSTSQSYSLTVFPASTIGVDPNQTITQGSHIILTANSSGGGTFQWTPSAGLSCTECPSPFASPDTSTFYHISLKDDNGCLSTDSVWIFVDLPCGEVFVPDAFSPNNDNVNEILYVKNECLQQMDFKIYDRWGNKVFEATNKDEGWDGRYNGKAMNPAVFVYSLQATLSNGKVISKKGNICLVW